MSMTIKELADLLGVSKTAVRNHMNEEFRRKHTESNRNGSITIDSDGCKLIAESIGKKWEEVQTAAKNFPESSANPENMTIPRAVWDFMEDRIKHLEAELAEERKHSRGLADELAKLADQAQQLHAGEMKQQRLEAGTPQAEAAIDVQQAEPEQPEVASRPGDLTESLVGVLPERKPGFIARLGKALQVLKGD